MSKFNDRNECLLQEVTRGLEEDTLDIAEFARRRDRVFGVPNLLDNFVVPAYCLFFGDVPTFRPAGNSDKRTSQSEQRI